MSKTPFDSYTIFLPNGEVLESEIGVPEIYRIIGTIVLGNDGEGPAWHRWDGAPDDTRDRWTRLQLKEVPAHIRAYVLICPQ